ncbi:MFS transporter [Kribbella sp. DT2]|uniref:MFS transporter n=1 Tax=Kribbella sp. DT2 TaxID=3393427 RepID=UPI003CE9B060
MNRRTWLPAVFAMFCCGWGGNQFTPLLLLYRRTGGYSTVEVDLFLGTYVVGLVPGLLVAGALSDRHGRKPLMLVGTALSVVSSLFLMVGQTWALYGGRLLTGVAVGIAMAVGTSWVKELSQPPFDPAADVSAGARRAAMGLTLGFGLGAGVAGVLAQWGPHPTVTPYVVHVVLALAALSLLRAVPESRTAPAAGSLWSLLKVPAVAHRRFLRVVLPMAPWVFGSAGIAYAVTPQLVGDRLGNWGLAYATLLTVCTLGTGALVQPLAKRLDSVSTARAIVVAMVLMSAGVGLSAVVADVGSPWLGLLDGVLLGAAYGIAVVSGLLEIQRIAALSGGADLAGLTGVYYAAAYTGFLLPTVLAAVAGLAPYVVLLGVVALVTLACTAVVLASSRRHLPA